ncbi:hypothetical protein C4580_02750 [Candidatus Woesearchaeota archaeon]|nr:MAG: hypothetical protein C4580_02750 [Candidatus Woesearchaeota archaeon]
MPGPGVTLEVKCRRRDCTKTCGFRVFILRCAQSEMNPRVQIQKKKKAQERCSRRYADAGI